MPIHDSPDEVLTHSRVDGEAVRFGSGWISGAVGILFGAIGLAAVTCFHFPDLLTMPELRAWYPLPLVRGILHVVLVLAFLSGVISLCLRKRKVLGSIAVGLVLVAALLGGSQVSVAGDVTKEGPFLGLDWFLLNFILWSAVFIPLERLYAQNREQPIFRRGWRTDLMYFFVSSLGLQLMTLMTLKPAEILFSWAVAAPWRAAIGAQPVWLQVIEILLLTDLVQYCVHRLFHQIPFLWRFHEIHHSTDAMDWLAGSRLHIVDVVVTRGLTYVPLFALGFADAALVLYVIIVTVQATFIHANVRFQFGPLRYVLATPQFHHWHHSNQREAIDKNFAVHSPVWDLLFGSFHLPVNRWPESYGVAGNKPPEGFFRQFVSPFCARSKHNRPKTT